MSEKQTLQGFTESCIQMKAKCSKEMPVRKSATTLRSIYAPDMSSSRLQVHEVPKKWITLFDSVMKNVQEVYLTVSFIEKAQQIKCF